MLNSEFGLETELIGGGVGEFTVVVNGQTVAVKGHDGFPTDAEIKDSVRKVLAH